MKTLREPDKFVIRCLTPQSIEKGYKYTLSPYVIRTGKIAYNALTDEAILVSDYQNKNEQRELIRRWFLVPIGLDISSLVHMIRQKRLISFNGPGSQVKRSYVIFTTTACNAACEYCFEKGCKTLTMSKDTANSVADYIIHTSAKDKPIKLKWFGGEPLLNKEAINIISEKLKTNDIRYWCEISSNGDLLSNCSDDELKLWKPKKFQLTVDDTFDNYDRIKGLSTGGYERLKKNLERLCKYPEIRIPLRLHLDPKKGPESCYRVIDDLKEFSNVRFYVRLLYNEGGIDDYKELLKVEDYIMDHNPRMFDIPPFANVTHCMADNPKMACITPTGELSPCEHYAYGEHIYGSIFAKEKDYRKLEDWSVREKYVTPSCKECPLYPSCRKLVMCPAEGKCSDGYQYYQIETIKRALRKKVEEINGRDSNTNN